MANVDYMKLTWLAGDGEFFRPGDYHGWGPVSGFNDGDAIAITAHPNMNPPPFPQTSLATEFVQIQQDQDTGWTCFFRVTNVGARDIEYYSIGLGFISK
jgi:hypothetical protein